VACSVLAAVVAVGGVEEETEQELDELRDERRGLLVLCDALRSALDLHSMLESPVIAEDRRSRRRD
jgi:hypothetical protein